MFKGAMMISRINFRSFQFMALTVILTGISALHTSPAQAGFEWTPVPAPVPAQIDAADPNAVLSVPDSSPDAAMNGPLTPEPDAQDAVLPAPVFPVEAAAPVAELPVKEESVKEEIVWKESAPAPAAAQQIPLAAPVVDGMDATPVQGFGKEIPLALALRQIVPPTYAYAFSSGEYAGRKVSWQGGKPWWIVLNDTLMAEGLSAVVSGNVVTISDAGAAPVSAPASEVPPMTQPLQDAPVEVVAEGQQPTQIVPAEAAPVASAKGVQDIAVTKMWKARPGETLRGVLEGWGKAAGVEVEWVTPYDYPIGAAFTHEGTFQQAVESMLRQYSRETPRPRGRFYPNLPEGPAVLMIN